MPKFNIDALSKGDTVFIESSHLTSGESTVIDSTLNVRGEHVQVVQVKLDISKLHELGITYQLEKEQAKVGNRLAGYDCKGMAVHETDLVAVSVPELTVKYSTVNVDEQGRNTVFVELTSDILAKMEGFKISAVVFNDTPSLAVKRNVRFDPHTRGNSPIDESFQDWVKCKVRGWPYSAEPIRQSIRQSTIEQLDEPQLIEVYQAVKAELAKREIGGDHA